MVGLSMEQKDNRQCHSFEQGSSSLFGMFLYRQLFILSKFVAEVSQNTWLQCENCRFNASI